MSNLKRILIIDDEESVGIFVKRNLEHTGSFVVYAARNGKDGLALAQQEKPDLILLDVVMPDMEGSDVAEALLQDEGTRHIPIIFLTAIVTKEDIGSEPMAEIGGRSYIAKPITTDKLVACINKVLAGNA